MNNFVNIRCCFVSQQRTKCCVNCSYLPFSNVFFFFIATCPGCIFTWQDIACPPPPHEQNVVTLDNITAGHHWSAVLWISAARVWFSTWNSSLCLSLTMDKNHHAKYVGTLTSLGRPECGQEWELQLPRWALNGTLFYQRIESLPHSVTKIQEKHRDRTMPLGGIGLMYLMKALTIKVNVRWVWGVHFHVTWKVVTLCHFSTSKADKWNWALEYYTIDIWCCQDCVMIFIAP